MKLTIHIDASGVMGKLMALPQLLDRAAAMALNEVAEETMTDAKEHTPVEYGVLRASGHVSQYAAASNLEAKLAFGTEYAVYVHENLRAHHDVGEAKFLENAMNRTVGTLKSRIAGKVGSILRGG